MEDREQNQTPQMADPDADFESSKTIESLSDEEWDLIERQMRNDRSALAKSVQKNIKSKESEKDEKKSDQPEARETSDKKTKAGKQDKVGESKSEKRDESFTEDEDEEKDEKNELDIEDDEDYEKAGKKDKELDVEDEDYEQQEEDDISWVKLGEELSMEVDEDSFESFKKSFEARIEAAKQEALTLARKEKFIDVFSNLGLEEQIVIGEILNGKTYESIVAPGNELRRYLNLSDIELVRENLKAQRYEDEYINRKIADLEEDDRIASEASRIRTAIIKAADKMDHDAAEALKKAAKEKRDQILAEAAREEQRLIKAIRDIDEYEGYKIPQKAKDKIIAKWKAGIYREKFSKDPKHVANQILAYEFARMVMKNKEADAEKRAKEDAERMFAVKMHRIEDMKIPRPSSRKPVAENIEDPFAIWEAEYEAARGKEFIVRNE